MTRFYRICAVAVLLSFPVVGVTGCAKAPPDLGPAERHVWNANEVLVALGTLQHTAIELNKVKVCPTPDTCRQLLSSANTDIVVDVVVETLKIMGPTAPLSFQGTIGKALDTIESRLDAAGKQNLSAYIQTVRIVAGLIPVLRTGANDGTTHFGTRQQHHALDFEGHRRLASAHRRNATADARRIAGHVRHELAYVHGGRTGVSGEPKAA